MHRVIGTDQLQSRTGGAGSQIYVRHEAKVAARVAGTVQLSPSRTRWLEKRQVQNGREVGDSLVFAWSSPAQPPGSCLRQTRMRNVWRLRDSAPPIYVASLRAAGGCRGTFVLFLCRGVVAWGERPGLQA